MSLDDITVSEVEHYAKTSWKQLNQDKKEFLLEAAKREATQIHEGRVATVSIIEGDIEDFVRLLAAHRFQIAEGGDVQSESSSGGSANYQIVTNSDSTSLDQTIYGREAKRYLRNNQSIGVIRS